LEADSAERARRALDAGAADIAILDLNLPGMDGMSLFEVIRAADPRMPVIVLTGYGELAEAQRAIDLEVIAFLTKPAPLGRIEAALARAAERLRPIRGACSPESGQNQKPLAPSAPDGPTSGDPSRDVDRTMRAVPAYPTTLAELERRAILEALRRHDGHRAAAAKELGISLRTLYYRLRSYDEPAEG
jgi:DNA-binding NtrC family response regulator